MQHASLGRSGLKVSRICLGMMSYGDPSWRPWIMDEAAARPFVARALELGINFFDTADMYSRGASEEITGRLLGEMAAREDVVIATKVFFPHADGPNRGGLSRKHILAAVDASLKRLGTDYIDLYQIHRLDHDTPAEEILRALDDLVRSGKVRYLGASSMFAWELARLLYTADAHGWTRFVSMQDHYNLAYREEEREMLPLCRAEGVGVIPWSPLARGFLAGARRRNDPRTTVRAQNDPFADEMYYTDADFDIVDALVRVADARGEPPARIALAWLLRQPGVVAPIVGATKLPHLEDAVAALDVVLGADEIAALEAAYVPHRVLGHG
ncbi:MAG: aldo/keto reductase [Ardenticatenales bacterium]|nr:aldo/keto reductase [Ardenticatenales bacterium]